MKWYTCKTKGCCTCCINSVEYCLGVTFKNSRGLDIVAVLLNTELVVMATNIITEIGILIILIDMISIRDYE